MRTDAVSGSVCAEVVPGVQTELQQRDALKRVGLATALTDSLRKRPCRIRPRAASGERQPQLTPLRIIHGIGGMCLLCPPSARNGSS